MKTFLILAHPEPKSFNGSLFRTAVETLKGAGHEVQTSDLYAMRFNPVSDRTSFLTAQDPKFFKPQAEEMHAVATGGFASELEAEMKKVEWCDLMMWQFPLWWFSVPAILKGWVDRVFAMGRFYGMGRFYQDGMCRGKRAMLSLTTGGPAEGYVKGGFNGDINAILRPIHRGIFQFVGFDVLAPHIVYGPAHVTDDARHQALARYAERLRMIEKEIPIEVGTY
jgi:NAD(P)H dehydrogenase (quinone)